MSQSWESGSDSRWRRFRLTILERDNGVCTIQGQDCTGVATQVDHIVPLSRGGGKFDPSNCRASCCTCNTSRGNRVPAPQPEPRPTSSW